MFCCYWRVALYASLITAAEHRPLDLLRRAPDALLLPLIWSLVFFSANCSSALDCSRAPGAAFQGCRAASCSAPRGAPLTPMPGLVGAPPPLVRLLVRSSVPVDQPLSLAHKQRKVGPNFHRNTSPVRGGGGFHPARVRGVGSVACGPQGSCEWLPLWDGKCDGNKLLMRTRRKHGTKNDTRLQNTARTPTPHAHEAKEILALMAAPRPDTVSSATRGYL